MMRGGLKQNIDLLSCCLAAEKGRGMGQQDMGKGVSRGREGKGKTEGFDPLYDFLQNEITTGGNTEAGTLFLNTCNFNLHCFKFFEVYKT